MARGRLGRRDAGEIGGRGVNREPRRHLCRIELRSVEASVEHNCGVMGEVSRGGSEGVIARCVQVVVPLRVGLDLRRRVLGR